MIWSAALVAIWREGFVVLLKPAELTHPLDAATNLLEALYSSSLKSRSIDSTFNGLFSTMNMAVSIDISVSLHKRDQKSRTMGTFVLKYKT